ncbi:Flp/Fap pilin component [compost metagenome]
MELQKIKQAVVNFIKDEEGLTIVEYAVAGGLITLAVVGVFTLLGDAVATNITQLTSAVNAR